VTGLPLSRNVINPNSLPYQIDFDSSACRSIRTNALKTNTIFEVVSGHGGVTAWADKHPAYELVPSILNNLIHTPPIVIRSLMTSY